MASRRLRIKAVANLPVRRVKPSDQSSDTPAKNGGESDVLHEITEDPKGPARNNSEQVINCEEDKPTTREPSSTCYGIDTNVTSSNESVGSDNSAGTSKTLAYKSHKTASIKPPGSNLSSRIKAQGGNVCVPQTISVSNECVFQGNDKSCESEFEIEANVAEVCPKDITGKPDANTSGINEDHRAFLLVKNKDKHCLTVTGARKCNESVIGNTRIVTDAHETSEGDVGKHLSPCGQLDINGTSSSQEPAKENSDVISNQLQSSSRLGRKRVKPSVSLALAGRRSRGNKECEKVNVDNGNNVSDGTSCSGNVDVIPKKESIDSDAVIERVEKSNEMVAVNGNSKSDIKWKKVPSIPGITKFTSICHPSHEDTEVVTVAENPVSQLANASIQAIHQGGLSSEKGSDHPLQHVPSDIRNSASESEDESRKAMSVASTITPPNRTSKLRMHRNLHRTERDAGELDDDAAESLSSASTVCYSPRSVAGDSDTNVSSSPKCNVYRTKRRQHESTLRLLEAKQKFLAKFGGRTPEKSRLTMFDFIFYNPSTNPMKSKIPPSGTHPEEQIADQPTVDLVEERLAEENVDEPSAPAEAEEEREACSMPVPQVKVGADGQIILDEKSLVIETTGSQKSREDLEKSAAVLEVGSGTYKAYSRTVKRSKDWPEAETLRFYRALQTVGTDFLLMQSIFPKRSRAELKSKYKKEERINGHLVEKALRHPLPFDLVESEQLTGNSENAEDENTENASGKEKAEKNKKQVKEKNKKRVRRGVFSPSLDKEDCGVIRNKRNYLSMEEKAAQNSIQDRRKNKRQRNSKDSSDECDDYNDIHMGVQSFDGGDIPSRNECDTKGTTSDSDAEVKFLSRSPQATRSGRMSKPRILNDITQDEHNKLAVSPSCTSVSREGMYPPFEGLPRSFKNIEPGSLVVLTTESPDNPGHQIVNVFMVSQESNFSSSVAPITCNAPLGIVPEFAEEREVESEENAEEVMETI